MTEEAASELADTNSERVNPSNEDMDLETQEPAPNPDVKRAREEGEEENDGVSKKQKVEEEEEKSVEEERLQLEKKPEEDDDSGRVSLGPKSFGSSVEMFDYFFKFLHYWPANLNVNKVSSFLFFFINFN